MHLIFNQRNNDGATEDAFKVKKTASDTQYVDLDKALRLFCDKPDKAEKMKKYFELLELERNIGKEKRELLASLKEEFRTEFIPEFMELHPEYFV